MIVPYSIDFCKIQYFCMLGWKREERTDRRVWFRRRTRVVYILVHIAGLCYQFYIYLR